MRIGVDLGGTKIEAICLATDGTEVARQRASAPNGDYAATISAITDLIAKIEKTVGQSGSIGIGIPGTVSPLSGLVKNANSTWLIGKPMDKDLSDALGRPVRLANDANCFALSEATDGAAKRATSVFGVILGTGVGGGIVINGDIVSGPNSIAGEWGHNPLPWMTEKEAPGPGDRCYCGKVGCIETFLNGAGLAKIYPAKSYHAGKLNAQEIADLVEMNEAIAIGVVEIYAERLARALASVINILDPEIIVLGGGLSNIDMLYDRVPKMWQKWAFSDEISTQLVRNQYGDSSGVRGAAWLWPPDEAR
ncbi:MAG: ROK family protein [Rhodospirillaceae bacterium]|nr:ROK family protein [Rhodospirillaceae bacterium]MBT4588589.1 ROK family protein [Rhodospirillaceae bacterium]MBT7266306.1 ROK family protein [Rhodospirillaceae bacterium]